MKSPLMKLTAFLILVLATTAGNAQSYPKMYSYKNTLQPSLVLPLPNTTDIAEETILAKLRSIGYKPQTKGALFWKKHKREGFYVFPGVQLPQLGHQRLDLYFRVDPIKNDPSILSNITMLMSKGEENFVAPQTDSALIQGSQEFLNSFVSETQNYKYNKDVQAQNDNIKTSQDKLKDLQKRQEDARKKIADLENDIRKMQEEEAQERTMLDSSRNTLDTLKAQPPTPVTDSAK